MGFSCIEYRDCKKRADIPSAIVSISGFLSNSSARKICWWWKSNESIFEVILFSLSREKESGATNLTWLGFQSSNSMQRNSVNRKVHLFAQCSSFANAIFADSQFATEMQKSGAQQQQQIPFNFDYFEFTHPFVSFSFTDGTSFEFQLPIFSCWLRLFATAYFMCFASASLSLSFISLFILPSQTSNRRVHTAPNLYE